jgi:hypothetical protein
MYTYSMNSPANVLNRFLDSFTECLTPEVAQRVADLRPDAATQARIDELREKSLNSQTLLMRDHSRT